MTGLSALTIVKGRPGHLQKMLEGFLRGSVLPDEWIIVDMEQAPASLPEAPFPVHRLELLEGDLPLAHARNFAAAHARFENLLFLDADCIPMRGLAAAVAQQLELQDIIISPEVRYLGPFDARARWDEDALRLTALAHPARDFPEQGLARCDNPGLFWSLAFGIRRRSFLHLGGFDEVFTGYGAEDTDFGFRAHAGKLPLIFLGGVTEGIGAFHQHHPIYDPPLQHFIDIARNASLFRQRWNIWPMEGWLQDFEQMGLIEITGDTLHILRPPTQRELAAAKSSERRF